MTTRGQVAVVWESYSAFWAVAGTAFFLGLRFDRRVFFLSRSDFGVTSTNSSSAIKVIACSRFKAHRH